MFLPKSQFAFPWKAEAFWGHTYIVHRKIFDRETRGIEISIHLSFRDVNAVLEISLNLKLKRKEEVILSLLQNIVFEKHFGSNGDFCLVEKRNFCTPIIQKRQKYNDRYIENFDQSKEKRKKREGNNSKFVPLRQDYRRIVLVYEDIILKQRKFCVVAEKCIKMLKWKELDD